MKATTKTINLVGLIETAEILFCNYSYIEYINGDIRKETLIDDVKVIKMKRLFDSEYNERIIWQTANVQQIVFEFFDSNKNELIYMCLYY